MTTNTADILNRIRGKHLGAKSVPASVPEDQPAPHMRHSLRVHYSKFNINFMPYDLINKMMRQQAVPERTRKTGEPVKLAPKMLYWCEENCKGLWMASPPDAPEYIMFEDETDFTLFLTAW